MEKIPEDVGVLRDCTALYCGILQKNKIILHQNLENAILNKLSSLILETLIT